MRWASVFMWSVSGAWAVAAGPLRAAELLLDPTHTFARFEIDHFGATTNRGRFDARQGTIYFDRIAGVGRVDIRIDVSSVNTGTPAFDRQLLGPDLLDAQTHPQARFVSDRFVFDGERLQAVDGQLTLRGQTRPVSFKVLKFNCYNSLVFKRTVCGGEFEAWIDRTDFGIDYLVRWGVTPAVRILLQVEAISP